MRTALAVIALSVTAFSQGTVISGSRTLSGGISIPAIAGTGGVTAKLLAGKDTSNPTAYILPSSGGCGSGIAATTASAAGAFTLYTVPGLVLTGIADNTVTAGHVLVGGTTTPGRVRDSGQTSPTSIDLGTCVVGVAKTSASTGGDVTFTYDGPDTYGTQTAGGGASFATNSGSLFLLGEPQNSTNSSMSACSSVTCFTELTLPVSIPSGGFLLTFVHNMASTEWLAFGLYDSTCTLIANTSGRVQGGATATFANVSISPAALSPGVYYFGLASTSAGAIYTQSGGAWDYLNQGSVKRVFTGSAPTGSTSTLAVPGTCGTRTGLSTFGFRPIVAIIK